MAVILSDGPYRVAHRQFPWPQDDHGVPLPPAAGTLGAPRPGGSRELPDNSWVLRLDPLEWPLRDGDKIHGPAGQLWTVTGYPRLHHNTASPVLDYVSASASLAMGPITVPYTG